MTKPCVGSGGLEQMGVAQLPALASSVGEVGGVTEVTPRVVDGDADEPAKGNESETRENGHTLEEEIGYEHCSDDGDECELFHNFLFFDASI